jgi:acyl-CoA synthetase (AMP-forming)/AMP-acid ligase II
MRTLCELLSDRARNQPDDRAYVFLSDRGKETGELTFGQLHARASAIANDLVARAPTRSRVLLVFPPGLDFLVGFFGCVLARLIPVPMMVPRRSSSRDASANIVADCTPQLVVTNRELAASPRGQTLQRFAAAGIECLVVDELGQATNGGPPLPLVAASDIALLQYTSGSTSSPKGVMVSHANLIDNLEMIRFAFGNTRNSTHVSWLPLYHDAGLISNVLQSLYVGALCVLMAPVTFMQRPAIWLRAISDYRAEVAGGPNFTFDLCVDRLAAMRTENLDLSRWAVAFNGAEPVRHETIRRFVSAFAPFGFSPCAVHPGYGMAEATVMISGLQRGLEPVTCTVSRSGLQAHRVVEPNGADDAHVLVGCGRSLPGERIAVVDPDTRIRLEPGCIGEIWAGGPNVAQGYWNNEEATAETFRATIHGEGGEHWLRTGDLGFVNAAGDLFITGRIKDILIVRGMNHYPQDIEATVQAVHPSLRRNCGAAFMVTDGRDTENVAVVQEVERTHRSHIDPEEISALIREAVANEHEVAVRHVALVRPGAVPKTTSGKIQRSMTRQLWLDGRLELLA